MMTQFRSCVAARRVRPARAWLFRAGVVVAVLGLRPPGAAGQLERLAADAIPTLKPPPRVAHDQEPIRVDVLVVEYNPYIPGAVHAPDDPSAGPRTVRDLGGWNDPLRLAAGYMQDVCDASGGFVQYRIVEWIVAREFQPKTDGHVYTPQEYYDCLKGRRKWRQPDGADYPGAIERLGIVPRVESGQIDEVWWFGAPYFGYWESAMAGRGAFYINGGVYGADQVKCERPFVIMGFNYERGVAEMLHDLSHRTEATMSRVYGGWKADELTTDWARFAANAQQSNGVAAAGTCHYPPNAEKDYDYANPREVLSTADDWLNYPRLTGERRPVTCRTWAGPYVGGNGQPDYHRNYMCWWFARLPKAPGTHEDGRQNNWWKYVFDYWSYDEQGRPVARRP